MTRWVGNKVGIKNRLQIEARLAKSDEKSPRHQDIAGWQRRFGAKAAALEQAPGPGNRRPPAPGRGIVKRDQPVVFEALEQGGALVLEVEKGAALVAGEGGWVGDGGGFGHGCSVVGCGQTRNYGGCGSGGENGAGRWRLVHCRLNRRNRNLSPQFAIDSCLLMPTSNLGAL